MVFNPRGGYQPPLPPPAPSSPDPDWMMLLAVVGAVAIVGLLIAVLMRR
jgi:hypothetical protein